MRRKTGWYGQENKLVAIYNKIAVNAIIIIDSRTAIRIIEDNCRF